jgi:hypothetical protein
VASLLSLICFFSSTLYITKILYKFNVCTLYEIGRFDDIHKAARKYKIDFLAVQDHRYRTTHEIDYINNKSFPYFFVLTSANKENKNRVGRVGRVGRVAHRTRKRGEQAR